MDRKANLSGFTNKKTETQKERERDTVEARLQATVWLAIVK